MPRYFRVFQFCHKFEKRRAVFLRGRGVRLKVGVGGGGARSWCIYE